MDFIDLVNNAKERICEANKKISFRQTSPIQTKKSLKSKKLGALGLEFSISIDEVIESALFDRITRDCKGELIRVAKVRRFRKVGSDEWFSLDESKGNEIWDEYFESTTDEEAIEQGKENTGKLDGGVEEDSAPTHTYATKVGKSNPLEEHKRREKQRVRNINNGIIGAAILASILLGYQVVKSKK